MPVASEETLLSASKKGDVSAVKQALIAGVNLEASDKTGKTPLLRATKYGHVDIIKLLLQHHANIAAVARDGRNVLHIASAEGHEHVIQLILSYGASYLIEETDHEGRRPSDVVNKKKRDCILDLLHEAALHRRNDIAYQEEVNSRLAKIDIDVHGSAAGGRRNSVALVSIREERDSVDSFRASIGDKESFAERRRSCGDMAFGKIEGERKPPALPVQSNRRSLSSNTYQPPSAGNVPKGGYVDPRMFKPISATTKPSGGRRQSIERGGFGKQFMPVQTAGRHSFSDAHETPGQFERRAWC